MNRKGLTRGDGLIVVCVLLVFIFSFLPFYGVPEDSSGSRNRRNSGPDEDVMFNAWTLGFQPLSAALVLLPLISLLALLTARFMDNQDHRPVLGLTMRQWSISTAVAAAWCGLWAFGADYFGPLFDATSSGRVSDLGLQYGAYVMIPAILVMALVSLLQDRIAGLSGPLAATPTGYPPVPGQYPGQYPGPYPGQTPPPGTPYLAPPQHVPPTPAQTPPPPVAVPDTPAPVPSTPAGHPAPASTAGDAPPPADATAEEAKATDPLAKPAADPTADPAAAPAVPGQAAPGEGGAAFAQFWFAVPEPREVTPVEGLDKTPVGTLTPGTWYLAVAEHGGGIVAEIDGKHGVLHDLTGIQRGGS